MARISSVTFSPWPTWDSTRRVMGFQNSNTPCLNLPGNQPWNIVVNFHMNLYLKPELSRSWCNFNESNFYNKLVPPETYNFPPETDRYELSRVLRSASMTWPCREPPKPVISRGFHTSMYWGEQKPTGMALFKRPFIGLNNSIGPSCRTFSIFQQNKRTI